MPIVLKYFKDIVLCEQGMVICFLRIQLINNTLLRCLQHIQVTEVQEEKDGLILELRSRDSLRAL